MIIAMRSEVVIAAAAVVIISAASIAAADEILGSGGTKDEVVVRMGNGRGANQKQKKGKKLTFLCTTENSSISSSPRKKF